MRETAEGEARREEEKDRASILKRLARARSAAARDLSGREDPNALREKGALLIAHFDELRTGMRKFKSIPLDPKLTPPENVDRLFQRARKAARAGPILEERIRQLDELIARVEAGESVPESRIPGRKKGGKEPPRRPYRTFTSVDGHRILVGKGGRDNDETTMRVAGPHDLFLHVRGTPGAHVILPLRRTDPVPEQALIDAAHLALHYSKSRSARGADVTYTRRKNVSKPRGAKPGLVQVREEKVLRLRREPERLARLLMSAGEGEE
jgi:predicted ribosome quality control (RQC) complex YloA/Tae2 family protein